MRAGRVAKIYRWLEYAAFGCALTRCRLRCLTDLAKTRRILVLGDGDGRFLAALAKSAPSAQIDAVDSSARMLAEAARRIPPEVRENVRFLHADLRQIDVEPSAYDAVVTHFVLDCFPDSEIQAIVPRVGAALRPGGIWVVSEFQQRAHGFARWHATAWLWAMYTFFAFATGLEVRRLPEWEQPFRVAGFRRERHEEWRLGLITASLWRKSSPPLQ